MNGQSCACYPEKDQIGKSIMILYLFGDYSKSITINRSSVKKEIRFAFAYDNYDETKFVVEVPVG